MNTLSIIIVNWNTKELTLQTIKSIEDHPPQVPFEIILVDNHSSDDTVAAVRRQFPQVHIIENDDNFGFGKANNIGMAAASGQYLLLLNSDTIVHPDALQQLVAYLDAHPSVMMVGPRLLNADGSFQKACRRSLPRPLESALYLFGLNKIFPKSKLATRYKNESVDPLLSGPTEAISGAAMCFRRAVFDMLGGFDEQFFMYAEDLDLCKQVQDQGWQIYYLSDAVITHLGGESSKQVKAPMAHFFYDTMWLYYKKHFSTRHHRGLRWMVWCGIFMKKYLTLMRIWLKRQ